VFLQRGITRLKRFNLSKIYGSVAAAGAVGQRCFAVLRSQADVPGGNGTRIYICVINATRQAVHVLSLSAAEVTYVGDLAWPNDTEQQRERDLMCAIPTVSLILAILFSHQIMLFCQPEIYLMKEEVSFGATSCNMYATIWMFCKPRRSKLGMSLRIQLGG
jgi:hypothetical protein